MLKYSAVVKACLNMEVVDFIIGDLITLSSRPLMSMMSGFITTLGNLLQMSMIM
jgi:hypothetical protein